MESGSDVFDDFVHTLRNCTPNMVIEALTAAFDENDLEKIAAELDELLLHINKVG
jgi:lipoate synthase